MATKSKNKLNAIKQSFGGNMTEKEGALLLKKGRFRDSLTRQAVGAQLTEREGAALMKARAKRSKRKKVSRKRR